MTTPSNTELDKAMEALRDAVKRIVQARNIRAIDADENISIEAAHLDLVCDAANRLKEVEKERDDILALWTKKHDDRLEELGRLLEIHSKQTQELSQLRTEYKQALEALYAVNETKDVSRALSRKTILLVGNALSLPSVQSALSNNGTRP